MRNDASEISTYTFKREDELLLDTNVWFSVYGPSRPGDWKARIYSKALADMLAADCEIYLDVLILSEYVNRYARLRHNILKSSPGINHDFKAFRKSPDFKPIAAEIAGDVRQIMKHCERIESDFSDIDIGLVVDEFESGDSDFNDQVLAEICKRRNLKLVTHDSDFRDRGLTILTANTQLL